MTKTQFGESFISKNDGKSASPCTSIFVKVDQITQESFQMQSGHVHIWNCAHLNRVILSDKDKSDAKVCWDTTWYNNSSPVNGSEFESLSPVELAKLCPGSTIVDAQCADDKFEGFSGNKVDRFNMYEANCNMTTGLVCHPFRNGTTSCPDMAIQYGCQCLNSTSTLPQGTLGSTTSNPPAVTYQQNGTILNPSGTGRGDNNGSIQKQFNLFVQSCLLLILKLFF
ncbi:hypothetical protein ACF0H5_016602 [Mactra antiquata]